MMDLTQLAIGLGVPILGTFLALYLYDRQLYRAPVIPRHIDANAFELPPRAEFKKLLGKPTGASYAVTGAAGFVGH